MPEILGFAANEMRRIIGKLLVIEEGGQLGREIAHVLGNQGIHAEHVSDAAGGLERVLSDDSVHVLLTDFELSGTGGMEIQVEEEFDFLGA